MENIENSCECFDGRITNAMLKPRHVRSLHSAKPSEFFLSEISSLSSFSDRGADGFRYTLHVCMNTLLFKCRSDKLAERSL